MRRLRTLSIGLLMALVALAVGASAAVAHPLGNLTSNTYAGLVVGPDGITIDYVLDLAEIPAFQAIQRIDADGDGEVGADEGDRYADTMCADLRDGLTLEVGGSPAPLEVTTGDLSLLPGAAGLPTLWLECTITTDVVPTAGAEVSFRDDNITDRAGWREVTARGEGRELSGADVPERSISDELREYPKNVPPLRTTTASFTVGGAADGAMVEAGPGDGTVVETVDRFTTALTDLVERERFTLGFGALAVAIALFLGALHALAPGHGKTVMAAYLVSQRGTRREALGLGLTVAVTHTLGVLILGSVLSVTQVFAPADLYPWLGLVSGLLFAAVGIWLLVRARRRGAGHDHHHEPHDQHHHGHHHAPAPSAEGTGLGWRGLLLPGLAGGLVPSPSALVVLVGGIALGRTWFGLLLVAAYGLGMAATLVGAGYALTRARGWLEGRLSPGTRWAAVAGALPTVTASIVVLGGVVLAGRSLLVL